MRAVGAQSHQSIMALARKSAQAFGTRSTKTSPSRAISNVRIRPLFEQKVHGLLVALVTRLHESGPACSVNCIDIRLAFQEEVHHTQMTI